MPGIATKSPENRTKTVGFFLPEKLKLLRGLFDPKVFKDSVRPVLYKRAGNDPEAVHELVLEVLHTHSQAMKALSRFFRPPEELRITINGKPIMPFGTAAGLDKNGDVLEPLSYFFGFLEPGTVVLNPREGNNRLRVAAVEEELDLYNAQGFPSKGAAYFVSNLREYGKVSKDRVPVYANVCGLPVSEVGAVQAAMYEMAVLLNTLNRYVDGFVWNPSSPNTAALKLLRDLGLFRETASLMKQYAPDKLRLAKLWTYEPGEGKEALKFVEKFLEGGGHGVVTTNTKTFPKEEIPSPDWGYPIRGRSGRFLKPYLIRSVRDIRSAFPESIIIATGGIYTGRDAFDAFLAGANMIEGYTPYTFYGLGLLKEIQRGLLERLKNNGYENLTDLQSSVKEAARLR